MKRFLLDFLYYSRTERAGIIVLLFICLVLFALPWLWPIIRPARVADEKHHEKASLHFAQINESAAASEAAKAIRVDVNEPTREQLKALGLPAKTISAWMNYVRKGGRFDDLADLERFRGLPAEHLARIKEQLVFPEEQQDFENQQHEYRQEARPPSLFTFDPNSVSSEQLALMGLPRYSIDNLMRYRQRGGYFKTADDLQKLYSLSSRDFRRLKPYVVIVNRDEDESKQTKTEPTTGATYQPEIIDINEADESGWQRLHGIGPTLSRRIIKFRDKLGGFYDVRQVAETYGLPDSTFQAILPQLKASQALRPLHINQVDAATLSAHPYMDFRTAQAIISYRQQHGPFASAADLRKVIALQADRLEKLLPYLAFD